MADILSSQSPWRQPDTNSEQPTNTLNFSSYSRMLGRGHMRNLWDHAILLLEVGYDWLAALQIFGLLLQRASNRLVKAALLLNMGMIHFQLADYSEAELSFQKALPLGPFIAPLAHFLLGLVRFETGEYRQATVSFKICAGVLHQTSPHHDYRHLGLDFVLKEQEVLGNEVSAAYEWAHEEKAKSSHRLLYRMSAFSMFSSVVLDHCTEAPAASLSDELSNPGQQQHTPSRPTFPSPIHEKPPENDTWLEAPRRDLHKVPQGRSKIARAAVVEPTDLAMLTHFLKSTGPLVIGDGRSESEEQKTAEQPGQRKVLERIESDSFDTFSQRGSLSKIKQPLRKISVRTIEKANSIRRMTKHAFSTPLSHIRAFPNDSEAAALLEGGKVHRNGPGRVPVLNANSGNVASQHAVLQMSTTSDAASQGLLNEPSRKSMESSQIFNLGRRLM